MLATWMTGSFSSREQAASDSSYFDIRLRMFPVWADRTDGYWFYVEQAVAGHEQEPYRQRIYHLTLKDDSIFISDVYTMDDPLRFAGGWMNPALLAALTPDSLTLREGCSIIMKKDGDSAFVGSTMGQECASNIRNAAYAVSEVKITPDRLDSWDRGFDAEGNQVWGAVTGGYIFRKIQ